MSRNRIMVYLDIEMRIREISKLCLSEQEVVSGLYPCYYSSGLYLNPTTSLSLALERLERPRINSNTRPLPKVYPKTKCVSNAFKMLHNGMSCNYA